MSISYLQKKASVSSCSSSSASYLDSEGTSNSERKFLNFEYLFSARSLNNFRKEQFDISNSNFKPYMFADFDETTLLGQLRASLRPLFKRKNIYLLLPLCSTGDKIRLVKRRFRWSYERGFFIEQFLVVEYHCL